MVKGWNYVVGIGLGVGAQIDILEVCIFSIHNVYIKYIYIHIDIYLYLDIYAYLGVCVCVSKILLHTTFVAFAHGPPVMDPNLLVATPQTSGASL